MLEKKLVKIDGQNWALEIPESFLKLMNINADTDFLDIRIEDDTIYIEKSVEEM